MPGTEARNSDTDGHGNECAASCRGVLRIIKSPRRFSSANSSKRAINNFLCESFTKLLRALSVLCARHKLPLRETLTCPHSNPTWPASCLRPQRGAMQMEPLRGYDTRERHSVTARRGHNGGNGMEGCNTELFRCRAPRHGIPTRMASELLWGGLRGRMPHIQKNTTGQPPRLPRRVKMNLVYLITCVILVSSLECNAFIAFSGFQFH